MESGRNISGNRMKATDQHRRHILRKRRLAIPALSLPSDSCCTVAHGIGKPTQAMRMYPRTGKEKMAAPDLPAIERNTCHLHIQGWWYRGVSLK